MKDIKIRYQKVSDAKRFFEILNNPNFKYFPVKPKSLKEEVDWLKKRKEHIKKNISHDFAIVYQGKVIGGIGIKMDQNRKHIGEVGYFIDEKYWGKGITTEAVKLLEKIAFTKLGLKRLVILTMVENEASAKVAIKNNYKKEGVITGIDKKLDKKFYQYAKVK
jgi:[ribosomal protein S5]-alanine N-acetyltransferase